MARLREQAQLFFTPEQLGQALRRALEVSDGHLCLYSQGAGFFPPSGIEPAYVEAIAGARRSR